MDDNDPIEARNERLLKLRTDDPVAWAICQGKRGGRSISEFLKRDRDWVDTELDRLIAAKEVKRVTYRKSYSYRPHSQEMKRLSRRAYSLRKEEEGN
jgi:hypothetical protein